MLDPQASMATITIRASNNPHGEVAFQDSSLSVSTQEGLTPQLTIVRQFGTFGEYIAKVVGTCFTGGCRSYKRDLQSGSWECE